MKIITYSKWKIKRFWYSKFTRHDSINVPRDKKI